MPGGAVREFWPTSHHLMDKQTEIKYRTWWMKKMIDSRSGWRWPLLAKNCSQCMNYSADIRCSAGGKTCTKLIKLHNMMEGWTVVSAVTSLQDSSGFDYQSWRLPKLGTDWNARGWGREHARLFASVWQPRPRLVTCRCTLSSRKVGWSELLSASLA